MDDDDIQQFSLRWHNHQSSIIGALGRMFVSGALSDVTLNANGVSLKAHRLVLAACSQYFAQIFKEVDDGNTVVVVVDCDPADLRQLLTFMYTGEVTAANERLPALLRLAHSLQVSGLTDAGTNPSSVPIETVPNENISEDINNPSSQIGLDKPISPNLTKEFLDTSTLAHELTTDLHKELVKNDKLSKLDQIVQNLYSSHQIGSFGPAPGPVISHLAASPPQAREREGDRKARPGGGGASVCPVCGKRLSNQYNLRVHMDTHAGRRHACRACAHVSRSRDALRKHVAYRHAPRHAL